ncbi:MAG TPA: IPT/TIG domain-containing protein, partial [Pyrinomonadaceae bacterium]|nr:IPT/TIG domain-containing protein [Pyrinomonadaceae bacterium]
VMAPQIVSDTFGKRIAQNFVAIQVTVANHNEEFQYLINDVSLNLDKVFTPAANSYLSSAELSLLRGVAEKGQGQDTRNRTLRIFRAVGTIAAGLIGVTSFGPSYPKSVAVFNGPVISAFSEAFPDYTINQMNRLSDSAYQANTLVPAKHSKVMVAFIPQAMFLSKDQMRQFWKEPTKLYPDPSGQCSLPICVDFRRAQAWLVGNFITEVDNLPPTAATVIFEPSEIQKFQNAKPVVKGYITGRFLTGATLNLLTQDPSGLSLALEGKPTANRVSFIIQSDKPVAPGTVLNFELSNPNGLQTLARPVLYMPALPTISGISPASGLQKGNVTVTLTGTNFIPSVTRVKITGSDVDVAQPTDVDGTSLKVKFKIAANAALGSRGVTVINPAGESAPITFTVNAAPPTP